MTRITFVFGIFAGSAMMAVSALAVETQRPEVSSPRPNILYLYVDDMGWGSIGPNGQAARRAQGLPTVRTPNLDRLARQGVNFRRGYGCHVCSPARSSQQSGFHQGHTFADRNDPNNAKKAMRAEDVLIGDALSSVGYVTGYWGKWGYGGSKDRFDPTIDNVQTLPTSHGYVHVLAELHHVRAHTFFQPTLWHAPAAGDAIGGLMLRPNSLAPYPASEYPNVPAMQDHLEYPTTAYCDDAYSLAALQFVRRQGQLYNQVGTPFFGLLAAQIPHAPFGEIDSLPEWDLAYSNDPHFGSLSNQSQRWAAMVTRIDAHIGNLLDALEDPNADGDRSDSIADQTLVVFQSDNGGPPGDCLHELDSNGGLRDVKGSIYEGGIRVPLVMRWPEMVRADSPLKVGQSSDRIVDVTDLLPTFCDLAGAEIPLGIDGVSIAPTLCGTDDQRERPFIIHEAGNGQSIIRGRYKLIRTQGRRGKPIGWQLYDIEADPDESDDIAADHSVLVASMKEILLGERVTEPAGFAVTYHRWMGDDAASMSDADAWTDYVYENAGVTYQTDAGPPQLSWIATMANDSTSPRSAIVDEDVEVLALKVQGYSSSALQTVSVSPGRTLHGRNEIRLSADAHLRLDEATASTMRWVEIEGKATLMGSGSVDGDVVNAGTVHAEAAGIKIKGDYQQSPEANVIIDGGSHLHVEGRVRLSGRCEIVLDELEGSGKPGPHIIIRADEVEGTFDTVTARTSAGTPIDVDVRYLTNEVVIAGRPD
ncbi:MAG: sulfatase-like hydrolase/transferase [Planctomycetota bacterium]